jgi:tetratricopeptide (TPR) repeat protein
MSSAIVDSQLGTAVTPQEAIDCLRHEACSNLTTDCPALDDPERRLGLASFLEAVLGAVGERTAPSVEDYRRALAHFGGLLADSLRLGGVVGSLGIELLRLLHVLTSVAEESDDLELWQRTLEWQVCARTAGSPRAQAFAVFADFLSERVGNSAQAGKTWVLAAREAEIDARDRRVPLGYWERAFAILGDDPLVAESLVVGYAAVGDWAQVNAPFGVMLSKATSPQAVDHCIEILLALKDPAIEQRASAEYSTLIDEVLWSVSSDNALYARSLMLAKAQVIAADPERVEAALDAYYALLDAHASDADSAELLKFIRSLSDVTFRHEQFARLFDWRIARINDPLVLLVQWAKIEETEFSDVRAAAALFERIVAQDPTNAQAFREIRRLRELDGDWDGVELTLGRLSEVLPESERASVELERAEVLAGPLACHESALEILTSAIAHGVDVLRARALLVQLLRVEDSELRLTASERLVALSESTGTERLVTLREVLSATKDLANDGSGRGSLRASALRRQWFEGAVSAWTTADEDGFVLASDAVVEFPDSDALWDALRPWSSHPERAKDIVELYGRAIERTTDRELVELLGKKMVAFAESATVDVANVLEVLMKVVRFAPGARWALDRVKLHLGAQGRWADLLGLYESAMEEARSNGDTKSEMHLLTEASVTAKDLASDPERAIRYFERILELYPKDARTDSALERLYERYGYTERLVAHLERRAETLTGTELRQLEERIAALWIDAHRADAALEVVRNELERRGDWPAATKLLERIFEMPEARQVVGDEVSTAEMAAQILGSIHRHTGRHAELTRLLRETLTIVGDVRRKLLLLTDLAETLETSLNDEAAALQVIGELLQLDPAQEWHRSWLGRLATRLGAADERVRLLLRAAEPLPSSDVKARLLSEAAQVTRDVLDDPVRAIELYGQVVECGNDAPELALLALQALDPLLLALGHAEERCNVLECLAESTEDESVRRYALRAAAQLSASTLADVDRAATNFRALLDEIPNDAEALEGFIVALEAQGRWEDLAQTLSYRINIGESPKHTIFDRKRLAQIHAEYLNEPDAAIAEWAGLLHDEARDYESRDNISRILAAHERWPELVAHLEAQTTVADDAPQLYRQLAEVHRDHTGDLRAATIALLKASDIHEAAVLLTSEPGRTLDDASLRLDVAEALRLADFAREAVDVLAVQVGLYADRKPKERSHVHLELARDYVSLGDSAQALEQLTVAIGIDPTNADILGLHGKLAFELGVLTAAEQSYRSLLLLAMHQGQGSPQGNLPALAVLYFRLAQIAERRGDRDRADELIASAFDAALNEEAQTRQLEQALIEARADDLLLKTLDNQLSRAKGVEDSASVLMDFASRRLRLGEPSTILVSRLRDRADQISGALANEGGAEVVMRAHAPLVTVYRLLGDTECVLALLLTWSNRFINTSVGHVLEVEAAKLMLDFPERRAEGIDALLAAWSRDSSRDDVAEVLTAALTAEHRLEDLAHLVAERIGKAERKRHTDQANALRLELGDLYERLGQSTEAVGVYESVVTATTAHRRAALEALSRVLTKTGADPARLCEVLDGLLELSEGRAAAETALQLAKQLRIIAERSAQASDPIALERALNHGFAQDPSYVPLREALVAWYREQGQFDKARSILELSLARSPRDRSLILELVELSEASSDADGALELLQTALNHLPDDTELNRRRWQLLVRAGRNDEALNALEREHARGVVSAAELAEAIVGSGLAQQSRQWFLRLVELQVATKAELEARDCLKEWLNRHGDDVEAHRELARLAVKANAWDEAVESLSKLAQFDTTPEGTVAAALDLAIACDKIGDPARAIPALERAKDFVAVHDELEQRLLKTYDITKRYDRMARVYVERSERPGAEKKRVTLLERAANYYLEAHLPSEASACLDRALALEPERLSVVLTKIRALRQNHESEAARALVSEHIASNKHARDKERYRLFEELATLHLDEDELVEAFEALTQAHKLERSHPRIALLLGLVAADLDDVATASSALRQAVTAVRPADKKPALSPGERAAAYAELARLQFLRGSQSTARQFFDRAVEEDPNHHAVLQLSRAIQRP